MKNIHAETKKIPEEPTVLSLFRYILEYIYITAPAFLTTWHLRTFYYSPTYHIICKYVGLSLFYDVLQK